MLDHAMMCLDNMMTHTSRRVGNRASGCERFEKKLLWRCGAVRILIAP